MSDKRLHLIYAGIFAFFLQLFMPRLTTHFPIHFLIPFIVMLLYCASFQICLWSAFGIGLYLDVTQNMPKLGFLVTSYLIATIATNSVKSYFFKDALSTLPIMTAIFSLVLTFSEVVVGNLFHSSFNITWRWFFTDCLCMSSFDALYSYIVFLLPPMLYKRYYVPKRKRFTEEE